MLARIFLALSGLIWFPYGVYCFFQPGYLADAAGIVSTTATGNIELRAMYGGLQAGIGALALVGALRPALVRPVLFAGCFLFGGLAVTRSFAALGTGELSSYTAFGSCSSGPRPRSPSGCCAPGRRRRLREPGIASAMPFVIEQELSIDAPAERVWAVVSDLARYPEWNPFVVSCASTLAPGDPIAMRVRIFARFAQPQREQILEHQRGRWLCYGLPPSRLGALASRRSHEVTAQGASRTRYVSHFELSGWLAPLVRWLLGARLEKGFGAMSAALKARAEALADARDYSGISAS